MFSSRQLTGFVAALIVLAGTGCQAPDPVEPAADRSFDTGQTEAGVQAMVDVFTTSLWESFRMLGQGLDLGPVTSKAFWQGSGAHIAAPVLPEEVLGTTYVYDPDLGKYVPDPEREGAPSNGVRFVLYAVNPLTHEPVVDAEVGYADLTDEGIEDPTGIALRLEAVSGSTTFLDYSVALDGSEDHASTSIGGFIRGRSELMEFQVEVSEASSPSGQTMDLVFEFAVDEQFAVGLESHVTHLEAGHWEQSDLRVESGPDTIQLTVLEDSKAIDATVHVNGDVFATITGPRHDPDVRGAEGRLLTPEEARVLGDIIRIPAEVHSTLEDLQGPVALLFALAEEV
ncbi:MAG: hypothetical protein ACE5G2_02300 [Candidatus Krumholzibacteriia bacterium]